MKRKAHVECLGYDKIRITTFCQQKEFDLKKVASSCRRIDLATLQSLQERGDFYLEVWEGNGSISEPYQLIAFRRNYDNGRIESLEPWVCIKDSGDRHIPFQREATFEATIWDADKRPKR